jgi:hypothetical protein
MIVANRRSFLAGLVSACAAPAIVTSSGFRAGLFVPRAHERWIAVYDITTDTYVIRADFSSMPLALPRYVEAIPRHLVELIKAQWPFAVDRCVREVSRRGNHQHGFDWTVGAIANVGDFTATIEPSIEKGLADGAGFARLLQIAPGVRGGVG